MSQFGILHGKDDALHFFKSASGDRKRLRVSREGMQAEKGPRNDGERAVRASDKFRQVVPRHIFYDFAAAGSERAVGKRERDADDQVAQRAEAKAQRTAVIRRENAADSGLRGPERGERKALAVQCERSLQFLNGAARFDAYREVGPRVLDDFVQACRGKNDVCARRWIAPAEFRAAASWYDSEASAICETKCSSDLLLARGLDHKTGCNATNPVGGSGNADQIGPQDRAEFLFDLNRSRRHW